MPRSTGHQMKFQIILTNSQCAILPWLTCMQTWFRI